MRSMFDAIKETLEPTTTIVKEASFGIGNDTGISKFAGLDIYQPTSENTESFIRKYVLNELAYFPKAVRISIKLVPQKFNTPLNTTDGKSSELIKDASGAVLIHISDKVVELPFLIKDSEFIPFDIIQMDKQRVPFSRENLSKVLSGIDAVANNPTLLNLDTPFAGIAKPISETTDSGFLGDTLRIQEQAMLQHGYHDEIVVASMIDELLEKTARIIPINKQNTTVIESALTKKYAEEFIADMEKIAEENANGKDIDNHVDMVFSKLKDLRFEDVNTMSNGQRFSFPEKMGGMLQTTNAIVFSEIIKKDYKDHKEGLFEVPNTRIVITERGDFITLHNGSKFYGLKSDEDWTLPTKQVSQLKDDKIYAAVLGDKLFVPFKVISARPFIDTDTLNIEFNGPMPFVYDCKVYPDGNHFSLAQLPGKKFELIQRQEALEYLENKMSVGVIDFLAKIFPYEFIACDESVRLVQLQNTIKDYLVDPKNLVFAEGDGQIFKTAANDNGKISITLIDAKRDLYDLNVEWRNTDKRLFKQEKRSFKYVTGQKIKGILKAANIDYTIIVTLLQRALKDNQVVVDMPEDAEPEKISGGYVNNRVQGTLKAINNNAYGKDIVETGLSEVVGRQLGNAAINYGPKAVGFLSNLSTFASESAGLSRAFEKIAITHNNHDMLNIAKLMTAQHNIDKTALEAYKSEEKYAFVNSCFDDIVELKPVLEDTVYNLITLKVAQYMNNDEVISPSIIGSAIRTLDRMYKIASVSKKASEGPISSCGTTDAFYDRLKKELGKEVDIAAELTKKELTVEDKVMPKKSGV